MKRGTMAVWTAAVAASAALSVMAETVTVNPPAGTVTNVRAFVTGENALAVNTGATGGTVHLNPSSTHTGGTTLGSGTLVVTQPARPEAGIGELGAGPFTQTGGTLRYAGPAGGLWTGAITNQPAVDTDAVVWQIDNDLTVAGAVGQPSGAFIKTGKGTLTFTEPFVLGGGTASTDANRKKLMDLSPDRAPTQGYGPVTVTDGDTAARRCWNCRAPTHASTAERCTWGITPAEVPPSVSLTAPISTSRTTMPGPGINQATRRRPIFLRYPGPARRRSSAISATIIMIKRQFGSPTAG